MQACIYCIIGFFIQNMHVFNKFIINPFRSLYLLSNREAPPELSHKTTHIRKISYFALCLQPAAETIYRTSVTEWCCVWKDKKYTRWSEGNQTSERCRCSLWHHREPIVWAHAMWAVEQAEEMKDGLSSFLPSSLTSQGHLLLLAEIGIVNLA